MPQEVGSREGVKGRKDPSGYERSHLLHFEDMFAVGSTTGSELIAACHQFLNLKPGFFFGAFIREPR